MIDIERTGNVKLHTTRGEWSTRARKYDMKSSPYEKRKGLVTVDRSDEES